MSLLLFIVTLSRKTKISSKPMKSIKDMFWHRWTFDFRCVFCLFLIIKFIMLTELHRSKGEEKEEEWFQLLLSKLSKAHVEMGIAGGILEADTEDGNVLKMFMCSWRIFFCFFLFTTPACRRYPLYYIISIDLTFVSKQEATRFSK